MDTFFNFLRKGLVGTLLVVFAFIATYTPQLPSSQVEEAHAGGLSGIATEFTQLASKVISSSNLVQSTLTAGATTANWVKDNVLDGIGWAIAKQIVSGIIRSLIDWVNSGFQGSPSFIQDFRGFMLNIADQEIGRVISELGDIGSFICSPFRLDVQISVALQYSQGRSGQSAPTCTLTGVIDNIEGFIQGIDPGNGLADWFTITSQPDVYTPYGAALSAQATARARIINAQGEERTLLDFGDGFQSQKLCRSVSGFTGSQDCSIVKPGRVIADQLNKALGAGQDSLVEADEINELVAALLGQLANQALTGVAGLLGLSGGDGFGGYSSGPSILDQLVQDSENTVVETAGEPGELFVDALAAEESFRSDALDLRGELVNFIATSANPDAITDAEEVILQIDSELAQVNENILALTDLQTQFATASEDEQVDVIIAFYNIPTLTSAQEATFRVAEWTEFATDLGINL